MKRLVIAGVLAFLVVLLVTFPAAVAYQWFVPSDVRLSGISGSIWHGSARDGFAGGAYIRDVKWQFNPGKLLSGRLAFDASASPGVGILTSGIAVGLGGALTLSDLRGNVPLDVVHPSFQQGGIRGDVTFDVAELKIAGGIPIAAQGSVSVTNFFASTLSATQIGDFRADFQTTEEGIVGDVQDTAGVLDVEGTVKLLPNRSYAFIGSVAPTPETPRSITNQLQYLGSPDDRGRRPFRFEGQL